MGSRRKPPFLGTNTASLFILNQTYARKSGPMYNSKNDIECYMEAVQWLISDFTLTLESKYLCGPCYCAFHIIFNIIVYANRCIDMAFLCHY